MFVALVVSFAVGSVLGWVLELAYRTWLEKRLVNPGFLSGPYLPIYGFGLSFLYLLSLPPLSLPARLLLFFVATTVLEYVTGELFLNIFNLRLWDYRDVRFNVRGMVCLRFSIYWTILSTLVYFFLVPILTRAAEAVTASPWAFFGFGAFYGLMAQDVITSFRLALRIRVAVAKIREAGKLGFERLSTFSLAVDMKEFTEKFRQKAKDARASNALFRFLNPFSFVKNIELEDAVRDAFDAIKKKLHG